MSAQTEPEPESSASSGQPEVVVAGPTISELRPGQTLRGDFACSRKDRLTARNGSSYLSIELKDKTGSIKARAFDRVDALSAKFSEGDPVRVAGRVERFRGDLVVELTDIRALAPDESDPESFLPAAYRSREELEGFLEHLSREIYDEPLQKVVVNLLFADKEVAEAFRRAPCTRSGHHSYLGGLLEHTVAVGTLALETCQLHPRLDSDLLMAAALLHDVGKVREFTYGADFGLTEEGRLVGHLTIGAEMVGAASAHLAPDRRAALVNCVLSHHGEPPQAGRGKGFGSAEALALYRLNSLDAGIKGALERGIGIAD
jgi:3'-5' exoribonuclease